MTDNERARNNPDEIIRSGFGLKREVRDAISGDYHCDIVEQIKNNGYCLTSGELEIFLAREFGFCYGVDRAVDYAYQTREMFPQKRVFLTTEIIHNPGVNKRLLELGIGFLSGRYKGEIGYDDLRAEDVVILPAFGASLGLIEQLRAKGCTLVDTTCGSVIHVWKRVEKFAREGTTSVIHGRYSHEETVSTCSRIAQYPEGRYIVVRDKEQAQLLCDFIGGRASAQDVVQALGNASSAGFDPARDLVRVGVANQTTMLSTESLEISDMLKHAMIDRYGEAHIENHFRSFETVCSATQERQDAIHELACRDLDLILVVGGYNSSNTSHLVQIASTYTRAYHIEDVSGIISRDEICHKRWDASKTEIAHDWLPLAPLRIGITAGASTPDRATGQVIQRIIELCGGSAN